MNHAAGATRFSPLEMDIGSSLAALLHGIQEARALWLSLLLVAPGLAASPGLAGEHEGSDPGTTSSR